MTTGINEVETVVQAMKRGGSDYVVKQFDQDGSCTAVANALRAREQTVRPASILDAIAYGVAARYGRLLYSSIVSETKEIARQLRIRGDEIERWEEGR